jgi:hypothetical protein
MRKLTVTVVMVGAALLMGAKPAKQDKADKAAAPLSVGEAKVTTNPVDLTVMDEPRKIAEAYLKALAGEGDDSARDTLFGGATLNARLEVLANWKMVEREPWNSETGELSDVATNIDNLDKEGRAALAKLMGGGPGEDPDGLAMQELDAAQAAQLQGPTKARAAAFQKTHPVFAKVARVDKEVYWHPKNPVRKLLADSGGKGRYQLDFIRFRIETLEGRDKKSRKWPLRLIRLRTDKLDTGWRVLPAADWNAE